MKRVAIFGNAGGGKSTLAKHLAALAHLPLYQLDMIQYRVGGGEVPREEYLRAHANLLYQDTWIIEGFGTVDTAWQRFEMADTLIHIDLPLVTHYWWVTKRLIRSSHTPPEGWPKGSPMWRSTMNSYRVIWPCHRKLTPRYRRLLEEKAASARVHHLRSSAEISGFLTDIEREYART